MKNIIFLTTLLFFTACATQETAQPAARNNSYNAAAMLVKEQPRHPQITLATRAIPDTLNQWQDVEYKRDLTLDIFSAKNNGPANPAVILVHGGGWQSGSKVMLRPLAIALAERGYVTVSINYRLSGEARYPAAIFDVVDAINWVKKHAKTYAIDPQKLAIGGSSAGGQMASLVAFSQGNLQGQEPLPAKETVKVQALLNIDGLTDFTSEEALPFENDPKRQVTAASAWLGGRYEQVPEIWRSASPYFYVTENAPPTLFLNSARERFHAGRDATIEKLNQYGIANKTITLPDTPHTFWLFYPWLPQAAEICVEFLQSVPEMQ